MKTCNANKEYKIKVGENIRIWRELKGLKQIDLAKRIEISPEALSNIENGVSKPNIERLEDIANALEIEVSQLLVNPQLLYCFKNGQKSNGVQSVQYHSDFDKELLERVMLVMEKITVLFSSNSDDK